MILSGAKNVFDLGKIIKDVEHNDDNNNKSWHIVEYSKNGFVPEVLAISAPSSEPDKRRANSADTYEFFFKKYQIEKGAKLLLLTSQIYVPYQHMEAIRTLAFKFNVEIETIGFPIEWNGNLQGMRNPVHYLQEIRGTIISISRFLKEYF